MLLSANKDSFTSSFPRNNFYFFFWLNCPLQTSSIVLNRSGKHRHAYFVPDFREKGSTLSPFSTMFLVGFLEMSFHRWMDFTFGKNVNLGRRGESGL